MSTTPSLRCPACERQGVAVVLRPGAALDGATCPRCGGTHIPPEGSARLLSEELHLERSALIDMAEAFGGRRFRCPGCQARTRALVVRGVDVDLCFHCGALWLEETELERLSDGRHRGSAKDAALAARPSAALARPDGNVRLDLRPAWRKTLGSGVRSGGIALAIVSFLFAEFGVVSPGAFVLGAVGIVVGTALRRRVVLDVFPRARRMLRSRRFMPVVATDDDCVRLDDPCFVVVRPLVRASANPFQRAEASYVDSVGRTLAPLGTGSVRHLMPRARAMARQLGAAVLVDDEIVAAAQTTSPSPPPAVRFCTTAGFVLARASAPVGVVRFVATGGGFSVENAVPARGDDAGAGPRAFGLCFFLEAPRENGAPPQRIRLHADRDAHGTGEAIVVVADGGEALGVVTRFRSRLYSEYRFAVAKSARRLRAPIFPRGMHRPITTDGGTVRGGIAVTDGVVHVDVSADADDVARTAVAVIAAVVAVDAIDGA